MAEELDEIIELRKLVKLQADELDILRESNSNLKEQNEALRVINKDLKKNIKQYKSENKKLVELEKSLKRGDTDGDIDISYVSLPPKQTSEDKPKKLSLFKRICLSIIRINTGGSSNVKKETRSSN